MQHSGEMVTLKKRWWQDMHNNSSSCSSEDTVLKESLGMETMGGPFVILAVGLLVALVISLIERKNATRY